MNPHFNAIELFYSQNIPLLDGEFDSFELNDDLDFLLHETENATLYHKSLHLQE